MDKAPIQLGSGKLGCPICQTPLIEKNAPYLIREIKVGEFNSLLCEMCRYSVLTEKGYEDSEEQAKQMGLIGIDESPDIGTMTLEKTQTIADFNTTWIPHFDGELDVEVCPKTIVKLEKETLPTLTMTTLKRKYV